MQFLCLVDFPMKPGDRWLWNYLPDNSDEVDFVYTNVQDQFASWGKILNYYPAFIQSSIKAQKLCQAKEYDAVIAWEGKNGFPYAIVKNYTGDKTPLIILTFSVRGIIGKFPSIQQVGTKKIDFMTVPTRYEKTYYSEKLNYPLDKIAFCELGVYDVFKDTPASNGDFIFSGGRSGRDYKTFFEAVSGTSIPVVVNAKAFNFRGLKIPANVECNDILPMPAYRELNRSARFIVLPLFNVVEAVGLTGILYAMAAGKAVIASRVPGASDYVKEGETGILVDPEDPSALKKAIESLWKNPALSEEMGKRARLLFEERYTFEKFANRTYSEVKNFLSSNG